MLTRFVLAAALGSTALFAADPYAALRLYHGTWRVSPKDLAPGAKPDELIDECAQAGRYFVCQQTVNGKTGALLVFVPGEKDGQFYTNNINPAGFAGGRGELEITGDRWTYSSKREQDGKTTHYRTINLFTGRDRIHYELAESADGEHWTVTRSGDEVRVR